MRGEGARRLPCAAQQDGSARICWHHMAGGCPLCATLQSAEPASHILRDPSRFPAAPPTCRCLRRSPANLTVWYSVNSRLVPHIAGGQGSVGHGLQVAEGHSHGRLGRINQLNLTDQTWTWHLFKVHRCLAHSRCTPQSIPAQPSSCSPSLLCIFGAPLSPSPAVYTSKCASCEKKSLPVSTDTSRQDQ